jgi:hypothetical protein
MTYQDRTEVTEKTKLEDKKVEEINREMQLVFGVAR